MEYKIRALAEMTPITEFFEDDVFIVGYPKSGNTWFQTLTTGLIYGVDPELAPNVLVHGLVPDVHAWRYYKRWQTPMFFKSHCLPRPDYKHVVYLLRDGRDVMVSYLYHNRALGKDTDFLRMVQTGEGLFPCKWHEHVEAWLSNPCNAQMIVIKYEDLIRNPVSELRRFCTFVGVERDNSFLELVSKKASFEKMRQKEIVYGWPSPLLPRGSLWPRDKSFVRRGKVGSHTDEMPPDVLEAFLDGARDTLQKCGYL